MKKKLRVKRVLSVAILCLLSITIIIYMIMNINHIEEYQGDIKTYVASYRQDDKVYTFDLKTIYQDDIYYVSLNDMYNMIVIIDETAHVYLNQNKHVLTYVMSDISYQFDYGKGKIVYNNECIDLRKNDEHIYISHKNIYISVYFVEKLLLKNEKKIKFENKNAIIQ